MKHGILAVLAVLASCEAILADSINEQDFRQLQQDRDKAVAAAVDPINRRYQASLETLLRRATMANELDLALKIRSALNDAKAAPPPSAELTEKADLRRLLTSGSWTWWWNSYNFEGDSHCQVTFKQDGSCKSTPPNTMINRWEIISPTQVKISVDKNKYWVYDVDLAQKEGRTNLEASSLSEKKCMRLVGKPE